MTESLEFWKMETETWIDLISSRFGGVEAGAFCALWSLYDQLEHDKAIDIYHLTKLYHLKRPGVIGSQVSTVPTWIVLKNTSYLDLIIHMLTNRIWSDTKTSFLLPRIITYSKNNE